MQLCLVLCLYLFLFFPLLLSVLCTVDLTKQKVSVQLEKVGSDPYCEMSINSEVQEKINVAAGTTATLSFLDCPKEELRLTASEVIGNIFSIFGH